MYARLVGQADEEGTDRDCEHRGANVVDVASRLRSPDGGQQAPQDDERDQADGDVDEEDPMPRPRVGDDSADRWPDQGGKAEDGTEQAQILAAFGRRIKVRDDGQRYREYGTAAQALEPSEQDQLPHFLAESCQDRADQEQDDRKDHDRAAPEEVGQFPVNGTADRGSQEIHRDSPGV